MSKGLRTKVRAYCEHCKSFPRNVQLGFDLANPDQEPVMLCEDCGTLVTWKTEEYFYDGSAKELEPVANG